MPTYEYACTACGERTEARQSFSDPPLTECPHCGGGLRKLYSPVGIVFKGSGFYSTDAKKSSKQKTSSDKSASSEKAETKSGKPEAKSSAGEAKSSSAAKSADAKPA